MRACARGDARRLAAAKRECVQRSFTCVLSMCVCAYSPCVCLAPYVRISMRVRASLYVCVLYVCVRFIVLVSLCSRVYLYPPYVCGVHVCVLFIYACVSFLRVRSLYVCVCISPCACALPLRVLYLCVWGSEARRGVHRAARRNVFVLNSV